MAPTTIDPSHRRVCFSFAAYAKTVIDHLRFCKIPVADGLSDSEFASIESDFGFRFPPDLRSILQEGLPVGPGFPNWRSASHQQLEILLKLPISGLLKEVAGGNFWSKSWGSMPQKPEEAVTLAKRCIGEEAPALVPIYQHCYISSKPNLAGNPVIYVRGCEFRYAAFDVAGFFAGNSLGKEKASCWSPAWAAKAARRVEFWSELVEEEEGRWRCGWWEVTCEGGGVTCGGRRGWVELEGSLEQMGRRLREGGWGEDEVREMLEGDGSTVVEKRAKDKEGVVWHMRLLSLALRKAGWSSEDVRYALGLQDLGVGRR